MKDSEILLEAEQAFSANNFDEGLILLRQYNDNSNTHDANNWHRQAVIEEQIGDFSAAGKAHYKCIEIAPHNAMGYLYAGYWLQKTKEVNAAVSLYSLADDIDASVLSLWQKSGVSEPTQLRSRAAHKLLCAYLSDRHRTVCSDLEDSERIKNAVWIKTHDQPVVFNKPDFSPELFYIPDLTTKPYYGEQEFIWTQDLIAQQSEIKAELSNAMTKQLASKNLRPYLGENFSSHSNLNELANSTDWMAIDLYKDGELNSEVSSLFPATLNALESIPTYNLNENPYEVFFSFLNPNQSIPKHFGQSNHALTVHLPLEITEDCYFKVASQKKRWQEGELLIFDDSFLHSAHNNSNKTRVVLIFSVWHPDLTEIEKGAVKLSFNDRQKWALKRQTQLQKLSVTQK